MILFLETSRGTDTHPPPLHCIAILYGCPTRFPHQRTQGRATSAALQQEAPRRGRRIESFHPLRLERRRKLRAAKLCAYRIISIEFRNVGNSARIMSSLKVWWCANRPTKYDERFARDDQCGSLRSSISYQNWMFANLNFKSRKVANFQENKEELISYLIRCIRLFSIFCATFSKD